MCEWGVARVWVPVFAEKEEEGEGKGNEEEDTKRRYEMYASEDLNVRIYYSIKLRIPEEERKANSG